MNTELRLIHSIAGSNKHGKSEIISKSGIYHQEAMFRARKLHATGTYNGKARHGMKLLKAYNKSPLVTMSQKGS